MNANQTAEWPEGVIARYLTVGGATVDASEQPGYSSLAVCTGCVWEAWSHFVEDADGGGQSPTLKVREWAQAHAEKCRAMPKPDGGAR
jgi:hypothetical protein